MLERKKKYVEIELKEMEKNLQTLTKLYDRIKLLLDPKQNSKAVKQNTPTSLEMISNAKSSKRYRRRQETKLRMSLSLSMEVRRVLCMVRNKNVI